MALVTPLIMKTRMKVYSSSHPQCLTQRCPLNIWFNWSWVEQGWRPLTSPHLQARLLNMWMTIRVNEHTGAHHSSFNQRPSLQGTHILLCPEEPRSCSSRVLVTHHHRKLGILTACLLTSCLTFPALFNTHNGNQDSTHKKKPEDDGEVSYPNRKWCSCKSQNKGSISTSLSAKNSGILGGRKGWSHYPVTTVSWLYAKEFIRCSRSQTTLQGLCTSLLVPRLVLLGNNGSFKSHGLEKHLWITKDVPSKGTLVNSSLLRLINFL